MVGAQARGIAGVMAKVDECVGCRVIPIEATGIGTYPDSAFRVLVEGEPKFVRLVGSAVRNLSFCDRGRVGEVVSESSHGVLERIEPVEECRLRM